MAFFQNDTFHFMLFIAISTGLCLFIGSWFLVVVPPPSCTTGEVNEEGISDGDGEIDQNFEMDSNGADPNYSENNSNRIDNCNSNEQTPLLSNHKKPDIKKEPNIGGWELLHNKNAILLILTIFFVGGSGLMYINNVGTIIRTLYYTSTTHPHSHHHHHIPPISSKGDYIYKVENISEYSENYVDSSSGSSSSISGDSGYHLASPDPIEIQRLQNLHVSLLSISSFLGRISGGSLSDLAKYLSDIPRISFLAGAALWLFVGQILMLFWIHHVEHLWVVTFFVGFGFGIQYGVAPTITGELFGSKRFGLNWGILACVSNYLLSSCGTPIRVRISLLKKNHLEFSNLNSFRR